MKARIAARTGQVIDPKLAQEVEGVLKLPQVGMCTSVVVTAHIRGDKLRIVLAMVCRRYDERALREQVAYDRVTLEMADEALPLQAIRIGQYDQLMLIRVGDEWDFCLTSIGSPVDALILRYLLVASGCATTVTVVSSGVIIA